MATLRAHGVKTFFGLPGSTEAPLLEAIRADGSMRYVLSLHESVAVAMADGYARALGRPAVVGLHTTVGTMNGMSQLFNAASDGVPVVLTAGHKDRFVLAENGFCAIPDLASLLRPFTKSSWQTLATDDVAADLARALHTAESVPSGPTFLAVPEDLMAGELTSPLESSSLPTVRLEATSQLPADTVIAAVAEAIAAARRPVLVLGTKAVHGSAAAARLAAAAGLAVLAAELTDLGAFAYPTDDPRYLGVYGEDRAVLDGCDLVVAVGCRVFYPFSKTRRPRVPSGARLLHVHPDAAEIGRRLPTDIGVVGDPAAFLEAVARRFAGTRSGGTAERERWVAGLRADREQRIAADKAEVHGKSPVTVAELMAGLSGRLPRGTLVLDEAVRGSRAVFRFLGVPEGGELWRSTGGALGWGLPAAVGAKLARPERPVLVIVGDGTFHFTLQALWTAVAEGAPVVVLVLDNGGYLAVKRAVEDHLSLPEDPRTHPGTEIAGVDHLAAAHTYGAESTLAHSAAEAAAAVLEGLAQQRTRLVSVPVARIRP